MQNKKTEKVMIIEDETLLLEAIKKKFEGEGLMTISCTSAEQALDYLKTVEPLPDVIWLDYYLENMNALELVSTLKSEPTLKDIPILVVSNSASANKVKSLLALGVEKYYLKANHRLDDLIDLALRLIEESSGE